jgi:Na+-transporting methylmalonyl-CoA/oxaloacetate decarboxylase beta subunit
MPRQRKNPKPIRKGISMNAFTVTVRTAAGIVRYHAIALCSCDAISSAIDRFGIATVSAVPMKAARAQHANF